MRLGWVDKACRHRVYELKKHRQTTLFDAESLSDYCKRFFYEVRGLGNVYLCVLKGRNYVRIIGSK